VKQHYDVLIIGAGPGGYIAAEEAARYGKSVAVVERQAIGGTCLNVGCIPSKAYLEHAHWVHSLKQAQHYGMDIDFKGVDFSQLYKRKNKVVQSLQNGIHNSFKSLNIDFFEGEAVHIKDRSFKVNDQVISGQNILLATGSRPFVPPIPGLDEVDYLTTDSFFEMRTLPEKLVIIGGGVIAVELAFALEAIGSQVTLIEVAPDILLTEDSDARQIIKKHLQKKIKLITDAKIKQVHSDTVELQDGQQYPYTQLLVATGRRSNSELASQMNLNFDEHERWPVVNDYYQTSQEHVYAIGDLIGGYTLAHAASSEGIKAVKAIIGQPERPIQARLVPRSLFTSPEVASFGLSEAEAKAAGYDTIVQQLPFSFNGRAIAVDQTTGFIKFIVERQYGEILGSVICGPEATEILHQVLTLCEAEGTVYELASTIFSHPTVSELVQDVAKAIVRKIS